MRIAARKRLTGSLAGAGVLAAAGGGVAVVAMSGGNGAARAFTVAGGEDPGAPAARPPSRPVLVAPTRTPSAAPRPLSVRAAAATAKPPPVVHGVRRSNVGAAHSPKLSRALSRGPANTGGALPANAGARGIDVASYQHPHGAGINWAQVAREGTSSRSSRRPRATTTPTPTTPPTWRGPRRPGCTRPVTPSPCPASAAGPARPTTR
jgi:hypothetical protein